MSVKCTHSSAGNKRRFKKNERTFEISVQFRIYIHCTCAEYSCWYLWCLLVYRQSIDLQHVSQKLDIFFNRNQ